MRPADLVRLAEARTEAYRKPGPRLRNCPNGHYTKSTCTHRHRVTDEEVADVQSLPYATAPEISDATGIPVDRVRYIRKRFGRAWDRARLICCVCDTRPVWEESPGARRLHLCKRCYLAEMRRRDEEERESAAVRQMLKRSRGGRKDGSD